MFEHHMNLSCLSNDTKTLFFKFKFGNEKADDVQK